LRRIASANPPYKSPALQRLWLILLHVLPKGFRRTRNFGFLHSNSKRVLELLQHLLKLNPVKALIGLARRPQIKCPCCGLRHPVNRVEVQPVM